MRAASLTTTTLKTSLRLQVNSYQPITYGSPLLKPKKYALSDLTDDRFGFESQIAKPTNPIKPKRSSIKSENAYLFWLSKR